MSAPGASATEPARLAVGDGEAHLHVLRMEAFTALSEAELLARFGAWMNPTESAKQQRFVFEKNRREYLMTRALVRATLSRYANVAPAAWTFEENQWGKPRIADGVEPSLDLRFNLSNTVGCVVMLVARGRDVGVDVEDTSREVEAVELAESHFAKTELASLLARTEAGRRERFFDFWTLKEAYIKARGMGLALPLDGFYFDLDSNRPHIGFDAKAEVDATPERWQFRQHALEGPFLAASAIACDPGDEVRIVPFDAARAPALRL